MSSLVPEDETYCGGWKALDPEDVQDGGFGEQGPKRVDHEPDYLLPQIPKLSEGGSLVISHGLIPFEGPDYV